MSVDFGHFIVQFQKLFNNQSNKNKWKHQQETTQQHSLQLH
jgi:hypothetical protein